MTTSYKKYRGGITYSKGIAASVIGRAPFVLTGSAKHSERTMRTSIPTLLIAISLMALPAQSQFSKPSELSFRSDAGALRFSRDGSKLLAATNIFKQAVSAAAAPIDEADKRLRVYDPRRSKEIWILPACPIASGPVLLMPDFKTMLTSWRAWDIKPVAIHSYRTGVAIPAISGSIGSFSLSPDQMVMAVGMTRRVEIWDAHNHKVLRTYEHGGQSTRVQFGPHGDTLLCSWYGARPHCISVKTARQIRWPLWVYRVRDADAWAFSMDGSLLARAKGKTIEVWETPRDDIRFAHRRQVFACKLERVSTLLFSPDGKTLAIGGLSQTTMPVEFVGVQ